MNCGAISKSDAVRAWCWGLIHQSALEAVVDLQDAERLGRNMLPEVVDAHGTRLIETAIQRLQVNIDSYLAKSTQAWKQDLRYGEQQQFLDFSASLAVEAMQVRRNPWDAHRHLWIMYSEFDKYEFNPTH